MSATGHFACERRERYNFIHSTLGVGEIIDSFLVDKGHKSGPEIHSVTSTGVIIIQNYKTNKIITELVGRPAQIKKLYEAVNRKAPRWLLDIAYKNKFKKYNEK